MGIEEARKDLGGIVNRALIGGEHTLVTRAGKPAAVIVPVAWYEQAKATLDRGERMMGPRPPHEPRPQHRPLPVKGTARSTGGTNKDEPADLLNEAHYPVEAECTCGRRITAESFYFGFYHEPAERAGADPCGGAPDHEAVLIDLSAYSMDGPNTGCVANPENAWHYPAEGICKGCGEVIRAEGYGKPWVHTGRLPGDPR